MKIALVTNVAWNIVNFRNPILHALLKEGHEVWCVAKADGSEGTLIAQDVRFIDMPIDAMGTHPVKDFSMLLRYWRLYRQEQFDVVLHYTIKPVIYGSFAARLAGIPVINTITGLGTAFLKANWLTALAQWLYRHSQKQVRRVFFQNQDDRQLFLERALVREVQAGNVPGSGVNLQHFEPHDLPVSISGGEPVFLLVARLLWDKGVGEFVEAARLLKSRFPIARFCLLGDVAAANRTAISEQQVQEWVQEGVIDYLGTVADVRPLIAQADCVVLPSYREGLPRSLLEAAAMGRPLIATDVTGCREVVEDGVNGFLCTVKDADSLAQAMERFMKLPREAIVDMGKASRAMVEQRFDERLVVEKYLREIDNLSS